VTPARILRAAEVLREDAECLRMSHTIDGEWPPDEDTDAREVCEEMLALARELEALAHG
jgi:hypothetical protein